MKNPVGPSSCVTPASTSNELDVQNEWEENTHTHCAVFYNNLREMDKVGIPTPFSDKRGGW